MLRDYLLSVAAKRPKELQKRKLRVVWALTWEFVHFTDLKTNGEAPIRDGVVFVKVSVS